MINAMLIVATIVCWTSSALAADGTKLAKSYKKFIEATVSKIVKTYDGEHYTITCVYPEGAPDECMKTSRRINTSYKYDLEKSNSLISPYIGSLEVTIYEDTYTYALPCDEYSFLGAVKPYNEAEMLKNVCSVDSFTYSIKFVPDKNTWIVLSGKVSGQKGTKNLPPGDVIQSLYCNDKIKK